MANRAGFDNRPGGFTDSGRGIYPDFAPGGLIGKDKEPTEERIPANNNNSSTAEKPSGADPGAAAPISRSQSVASNGEISPAQYKITFPGKTSVKLHGNRGDGTYKILGTEVEDRNAGQVNVTFTVRLTNSGPADISFGSSSFRLVQDEVPRAPTNFLNEIVEARSAKEAEVIFGVPLATQALVLQINNGEETADIPVTLQKKE